MIIDMTSDGLVDKDSTILFMQELFDTQKCPYHLKACDALKKDDTWLILALAQTDNENIAAYAQQLKYFENLCKSKNINVRLIDDRPIGQCSCCDPIVADSYEELVKCLAAGKNDDE